MGPGVGDNSICHGKPWQSGQLHGVSHLLYQRSYPPNLIAAEAPVPANAETKPFEGSHVEQNHSGDHRSRQERNEDLRRSEGPETTQDIQEAPKGSQGEP